MRRLTTSELTTFLKCPRRWWLGTYRRLAPRNFGGVSAAGLGTIVHRGLQTFYSTPEGEDPAECAARDMEALAHSDAYDANAPGALPQLELAQIMVAGYADWVEQEGADAEWAEVLGAEVPVSVELPELGVELLAKLDMLVRRGSDGALLSVDHKTCQSLGDLADTAYGSWQFRTQQLILEMTHGLGSSGGIVVNGLRKVKRTAKANPPFYGRTPVWFNPDVLRAHYRHVRAVWYRIDSATQALDEGQDHHGIVPPAMGGSRDCRWWCPFVAVCGSFDDGGDPESVLAADFEDHDPMARYAEEEGANSD
jgi:hypothetical protein